MKRPFLSLLALAALLCPAFSQTEIERKFSLGGWLTEGNTRGQSLHADFFLNRDRKGVNEITCKGSLDHESSAGADTMFKAYSSLRYAHSLSPRLYNFYLLEAEHDRFQDIDLRTIPTVGVGHWFANEDGFKFMVEGALGYQRNYLVDRTADELVVFKLSSSLRAGAFSNEFDYYTSTSDPGNFRLVNYLSFKVKLNSYYSFKWSLKDEYNNRPPAGVQKNDLRFVASIEYAIKQSKFDLN